LMSVGVRDGDVLRSPSALPTTAGAASASVVQVESAVVRVRVGIVT
jgi:hypothetical protein